MAAMNIFEIKNLSYSYAEKKIFSNINLSQKKGDIVLWSGDSGIGKSTLAKILTGHIPAFTQSIYVLDSVLTRPRPECLYVCHENDLFPWQTMRQHLDFLQKNLPHLSLADSKKTAFYSEVLELQGLLDKYPSQISMGQARRLQILRSLVLECQFVIFDETFSALDSKLKERLFPQLFRIWKKNETSIIIISHDSIDHLTVDQTIDFSLLVNER